MHNTAERARLALALMLALTLTRNGIVDAEKGNGTGTGNGVDGVRSDANSSARTNAAPRNVRGLQELIARESLHFHPEHAARLG